MHVVVFALIGGLIGAAVPTGHLTGIGAGAVLGVLLAKLDKLRDQVNKLERRVDR